MKIKGTIMGEFISRPNRFQAYVILNNQGIMVAVPKTPVDAEKS